MSLAPDIGDAHAQDSYNKLSNLKLSGDQPIQIESNKLEVRNSESLAIFTGNVSLTQGSTVMKAGKLTVYYAKGFRGGSATIGSANIDKLEVNDKVYVKFDKQIATGDRGTFDLKTKVLTMSGNKVVLSEGDNVLVGCKLTIHLKIGLAQVDGCNNISSGNGRVMMSITPGSQKK